jgi:hypothetical protein
MTCLGFNQPYDEAWNEELAEIHNMDLYNLESAWGYAIQQSWLDDQRATKARKIAKAEHEIYQTQVKDDRQTVLFDEPLKPSKISKPKEVTDLLLSKKKKGYIPKPAKKERKKKEFFVAKRSAKGRFTAKDATPAKDTGGGVDKKSTSKPIGSFSFLGWVLEFTVYCHSEEKAIRWTWRDSEALAMLSNDSKSLFITRMVENIEEPESAPRTVKKVKKLFETWSKKRQRLQWSATVEDVPAINPDFEPMSIKYWSDKYKDDPLGQVYYHEFEQDSGIQTGFNLFKNFPKEKPIAIKVIGCKITGRGIE